MGKIILASSSPRRIQIMKDLGVKFEAMDSRIKEEIDIEHSPYEWVKVLSSKKAHAVVENVEGPAIIIAADTVIADLGRILTKPDSRETASKMLRQLQGRHHTVYTGTTFLFIDESGEITEENFVEGTEVTFNKMSIDEINAYLDTFEYADKAGSYAIQGKASIFIDTINGNYGNVVGLSPSLIYQTFKKHGLSLMNFWNNEK